MKRLDQLGDTDFRELHLFSKLYALPGYVKQADARALHDEEVYRELPPTAFADPRFKQFPTTTRAETWLSYAHFLHKQGEMPQKIADWVRQRLQRAADYHGIRPDIQALEAKYAELHREELDRLPDSAFALVVLSDGRKERRYPLRNLEEVKAAAEWLLQYRDQLVYRDRRTIAGKILEKAAQFGADLSTDTMETLQRIAGLGAYDPEEAAGMLADRAKAAWRNVRPGLREAVAKLAKTVRANPHLADDPEAVRGLCETIDQFDRHVKIAGKYDEDLPRPEDVFCRITETRRQREEAFVKSAVTLANGSVFRAGQFQALRPADVQDLLGEDVARAVSDGMDVVPEKMAAVAASLDRQDADALETILREAGQEPTIKSSAAPNGIAGHLARIYANARP